MNTSNTTRTVTIARLGPESAELLVDALKQAGIPRARSEPCAIGGLQHEVEVPAPFARRAYQVLRLGPRLALRIDGIVFERLEEVEAALSALREDLTCW